MHAGMSGLGVFISGEITLGTLRVTLQVAGRRHGKAGSDHALAKVLASDLDRSNRTTVALLARQADRTASRFQQLRRIVLCRLAARPAAIRIST